MKLGLIALLLSALTACSANHSSVQDTSTGSAANATSSIKTVTVGPQTVDCVGVGPMQCLVVDDAFFYDQIQGFNFEPGYQYQLKIEQRTRFTPQNAPADASLYEYHLVEVLNKTPQ